MSKTIGVIGLGSIGMRHARNLLAMGHRVVGYDPIDAMPCHAATFDYYCGIEFTTLKKVLESEAIVIASPTSLHLEHIQVTEGRPTFVEKPIAYVLPMYIDHVVAVGNNLRFHSCVKKAKEWLDEKLIGEPIWARFTVSQLNKKLYKEDVVLNWGSHETDLARYLLGDAMVVSAHGNHNLCDCTITHLGNGCQSTVHMDYLTEPEIREFSIVGTKGWFHGGLVNRVGFLQTTGEVWYENFDGHDTWDENYVEEMQAFVDAIDGKPSPLLATGRDGLAALEMILKIKELARIE